MRRLSPPAAQLKPAIFELRHTARGDVHEVAALAARLDDPAVIEYLTRSTASALVSARWAVETMPVYLVVRAYAEDRMLADRYLAGTVDDARVVAQQLAETYGRTVTRIEIEDRSAGAVEAWTGGAGHGAIHDFALYCGAEWASPSGRHRCSREVGRHTGHRCACGAEGGTLDVVELREARHRMRSRTWWQKLRGAQPRWLRPCRRQAE